MFLFFADDIDTSINVADTSIVASSSESPGMFICVHC